MKDDWRLKHQEIMEYFLKYLNKYSEDYVLKDGTALMECYSLDCFSEDISLDGRSNKIIDIVDSFCKLNDIEYTFIKNTNIVKRIMLHYEDNGHPLIIEVSYLKQNIDDDEKTKINGITVYKINSLMGLKLNAFLVRDKIRDLYDICFIYNHYRNELDKTILLQVRNAFAHKGYDYVTYMTATQKDDLIDEKKLLKSYLEVYDSLGLR